MLAECELLVMNSRSVHASIFRALFGGKRAQLDSLAVHVDVCRPSQISCMKTDASTTGSVVCETLTVPHILRTRAFAQIMATIVKSVVIFVVSLLAIAKQIIVHIDPLLALGFWIPLVPNRIVRLSRGIPVSVPIPSHQEGIIGRIDSRHLALRKRNQFYRLIERLNNRFAVNAILGHNLTSNEIAVFDRSVILQGRM